MSSVLPVSALGGGMTGAKRAWLLAGVGFAAMYLPVYWWAANSIWQSEEQGHGALILAVMLWLFWGLRKPIDSVIPRPAPVAGWVIFGFGLFVYFVGQVFQISILEFGSQPFVVAGILLLLKGPAAVRVAWFALFYFIFMIPLPGVIVDAVTGPLKQWISVIVVELLYDVGYPIARNGVVLTIGQYQMLVADACSGLHSMYSLSALGTLFMYIMARRSKLHNAIMLVSILPIAFVGQHRARHRAGTDYVSLGRRGRAGVLARRRRIVLMLVALMGLFALDALLGRVLTPASKVWNAPLAPPR